MTEREKIAAKIRALRAKTVDNGCTEDEAIAAAAMVAKLLERYNMTVDEAEMRSSPFERREQDHEDAVGTRCLWKVASAVAELVGTTYWVSPAGSFPVTVTFFGFSHEVDISSYLLDICAGAMRVEQSRILHGGNTAYTPRQRNKLYPFLDGMADRLAKRLRDLKPPTPTGTGLVLVRNELIAAALEDAGLGIKKGRGSGSRSSWDAYRAGQAAGDKVALNEGVAGPESSAGLLN